jgi:lysophospholipase L1-like esterase
VLGRNEKAMKHGSTLRYLAPLLGLGLAFACSEGDAPREEEVLPILGDGSGVGGTAPTPGSSDLPGSTTGGAGAPSVGAGGNGAEVVPGDVLVGAGNAGQSSDGAAQGGTAGAPAIDGAGGASVVLNPMPADGVLRIMAVGDSITRATCWRARLWDELNTSFAGRFDMVGTLSSDSGCSPANYDRDNQGYSSSLITEIVAGITTARTCDPACPTLADLSQAFVSARPDVLLMHFGTNDVWNGRAAAAIQDGYSQVVDAVRAANPRVIVLVAQIIPMNPQPTTACPGCVCASCGTAVPALDQQIVGWAAGKSTAESPIVVVDQLTGYDATADNVDGVHPNAQGSQKMADRWFQALSPLFGG